MRLEEKPTLADENCLQGISFAGKSFYLDLPTNRQTQLLTKAICRLDGVIESFLSRDVDYVVTGSRKTVSSTSGSPVVTNKAEPPKCLVSAKIQTVHCSRGKQLLKKVIHSQEYSSVLTSARSWGVSVLYVDEVWAYLENLERPSAQTHPGTRTKGRNSTVPPLRIAILRSPFIKIEDQSRKFCPLKCTFTSFPEFSFMSSDRSPFENTQTANGLYKEKEPREQEEDETQQSQKPQLKKRKGYCECCEETFDVLCEHLVGKRHIQFISDTLNYKIIDDIALRLTCDLLEPPCRSLHNLKADHATSDPNNLNSNNLLVDTRDKGQNQDVLCTDGVDKVLCIQNKDEREIPLQHGDEVSNGTAKDLYEISINSAQTAKKPCNVPSGKMLNLTVGNDSDLQPDNVKSPSKLRKGTISDHQVLQTDCDRDGSQLSLDCVDVQGPINTEQHHRLVTEQMLIAVAEPKSCHSSGYGAKDQCSLVKDLLSQGGDLHKDVQVDETAPIPDLDQLLRSSSGKLSLEQTIGDTTTDKLSRLPLKDKLEEPCVELQKPTTHLNRTDDELNSLLRSSTSIFHEKLSRESHLLPPEQLEPPTSSVKPQLTSYPLPLFAAQKPSVALLYSHPLKPNWHWLGQKVSLPVQTTVEGSGNIVIHLYSHKQKDIWVQIGPPFPNCLCG
ncbi:hypothetical protein GDO86_014392 [Hymenochirus boettgeri]|nr:hypothetical protein GDO86_014392 [Hymenochirus boettgeri]